VIFVEENGEGPGVRLRKRIEQVEVPKPRFRERRPGNDKEMIRSARLSEDLSRRIDAWIAAQPEPRPSRSEAIRFALRDWLASQSAIVKSTGTAAGPRLRKKAISTRSR
jgi:Arc/MetJ-type ribon-helix-helix transcriptional regulator